MRSSPRSDRYVLLERLGGGGQAEVWRARREGALIQQEVCIKRLRYPLVPAERRKLLEEARILARVRHPNVVSVLDVIQDETGALAIVLELVVGMDLRMLQLAFAERREQLSSAAVAGIGVGLCRGLAAAQRAVTGGVVHRDISPHNVLLSLEGEVKLADFGIARARDRERWTTRGRIQGKAAYLSPEQVRGEPLDIRSDLFAVGVVLYELLAGHRPFGGVGRVGLLRAIAKGDHTPLAEKAPHAAPLLVAAVERLLCRAPEGRPARAEQAIELLRPCLDAGGSAEELARAVRRAGCSGLVLRGRQLAREAGCAPLGTSL